MFGAGRPVLHARGAQRVEQQAGDGHRPDAARHRRERAGDFRGFGISDIADDARFAALAGHPVDADIDHRRARLDPVAAHHLRSADRGDQHIRAAANRRQIARLGMGDGHRGILGEQQLRHRLADDVGAADHHRLHAGERSVHGLGQHDAAERRARHQARQAAGEPAGIERMESIHVLVRIDGGDDFLRIDLRRQRQLHQDAVHLSRRH